MEETSSSIPAETAINVPITPIPVEPIPVQPVPVSVSTRTDTRSVPAIATTTTDAKETAGPTTTAEEDRKTKGQRNINLIWETSQAVIAVGVSAAVIWAELHEVHSQTLTTAFTSIMMLYFVRMNHIKTGGIGGTDSR